MFKLIILMGALIFFALCAFMVYRALKLGLAYSKAKVMKEGWKVQVKESESHPITSFYLVCGDKREFWTSVNRLDEDYDDKEWRALSAAKDECDDRNSVERALNESNR